MGQRIGFLVVNQKTGYMLEGKDHAAKIFDREADARGACKALSFERPVPLNYDNLARSLLKGASFSFETEEGHRSFLNRLRNDMPNKPMVAFSQDQHFIKWRFEKKPDAAPANVVNDVAAQVPAKPGAGSSPFNPDILVRTPFV
jgi:hypothetical protein